MPLHLRLGTRKSQLAQIQTNRVKAAIESQLNDITIEVVLISTEGDRDKVTPLSELGGKGVFVKALEQALIDNKIDIAVHSLKDMTSELPDTLALSAFLKPEAIEDALISPKGYSLETLPKDAVVGTSSMRRKALIQHLRPDLKTADLRGNIDTRIKRCESGDYDAILLSKAGLLRMGWQDKITQTLDTSTFVPAPGQGVIALQTRKDDLNAISLAAISNHEPTETISRLELQLLYKLGLDCRFPFGAVTTLTEDKVEMTLSWSDINLTQYKQETFHFLLNQKDHHINTIADAIKADLEAWS